MASDRYILNDRHQAVPCADLLQWAAWFENTTNRQVAETFVRSTRISTVFLGLNHRWFGEGPPLLFETMTFDKDEPELCERCSTWNEAVAQHLRVVDTIRSMKPPGTELELNSWTDSEIREERATPDDPPAGKTPE